MPESTGVEVEADAVDVQRIIAQLDELAETQLPSRIRELRRQIEEQIAALVREKLEVDPPAVTANGLA